MWYYNIKFVVGQTLNCWTIGHLRLSVLNKYTQLKSIYSSLENRDQLSNELVYYIKRMLS